MIWNIIKKDWKLTGRWATGVIVLQLVITFFQMSHLWLGAPLWHMVWALSGVFWVVTLVQQDALPGTRQDWLARPIRRMDMLLAKTLLAAMVLQGTMFAGELVQGIVGGFPLTLVLRTVLLHVVLSFVMITIPALLIGVLSQNLTQSIVVTVLLGVATASVAAMLDYLARGNEHLFDSTSSSGIHWIVNILRIALVAGIGACILISQYRTRKTSQGRVAIVCLGLLLFCTQLVPWSPVYAIEKKLSPMPGAADGIGMQWNPSPTPQDLRSASHFDFRSSIAPRKRSEIAFLALPISVTGLPADSVLVQDNARIVVTDAEGKKLREVDGGSVMLRRDGVGNGPTVYKQTASLPVTLYRENPERIVHVRTTFSMTLFKLVGSYSVPAINGDVVLPGVGHCRSDIKDERNSIEVSCTQMGKAPVCIKSFLEDSRDGSRNSGTTDCKPEYVPYIQTPLPIALTDSVFYSQFRTSNPGDAKFAVDESELDHAVMVIRVYQPAEHFTRTVNSPVVTMKDITDLHGY